MRYRLSSPWPLAGGSALAPSGTVINTDDPNALDTWSRFALGLTPPWNATALDQSTFQFMQDAYPNHHHLMGKTVGG
jgi:hypothetical protein